MFMPPMDPNLFCTTRVLASPDNGISPTTVIRSACACVSHPLLVGPAIRPRRVMQCNIICDRHHHCPQLSYLCVDCVAELNTQALGEGPPSLSGCKCVLRLGKWRDVAACTGNRVVEHKHQLALSDNVGQCRRHRHPCPHPNNFNCLCCLTH